MKTILISLSLVILALVPAHAQNPRNVLIYNLTSTDCGPCSCMDSILGRIALPDFPRTIVLSLHGIGSVFGKYQGDSARNYFNADYEPSGFIDGLGYDTPHTAIRDSLAKRYANSAEAPVKIEILSKTWNPVGRNVNFTLKATNLGSAMQGSFRYNVIVTENNIRQQHRTMQGCCTPDVHGLPFRQDYFNNWVVRKMQYWSKGDSLIGPSWAPDHSVSRTCTVHIDSAWLPENCEIVITVYKKSDSLYKSNIQQAIRQSVTGGVGIAETNTTADGIMLVHPSPSKGVTNVHFSVAREGNCNLSVLNAAGKVVQVLLDHRVSPGLYNAEFDAGSYPPGLYLCVLKTVAGITQKKMIVR